MLNEEQRKSVTLLATQKQRIHKRKQKIYLANLKCNQVGVCMCVCVHARAWGVCVYTRSIMCVCVCVHVCMHSIVSKSFATPWIVACPASPSMELSRQEH